MSNAEISLLRGCLKDVSCGPHTHFLGDTSSVHHQNSPPLLPILFLHYRVRRVEKIPKYQKMKLQKIPKYSSTKIPKYPNIKVLKDEIIKRSPSCSFARGELEKMIKRPKHPSPPYHLCPSKTFSGTIKVDRINTNS